MTLVTQPGNAATGSAANEFTWHPDYAGNTFEGVERDLTDEIQRDQRSYHQALEQAEKEEFDAFQSVRELDKRWSDYDFGWFDVPPEALARRIVAFERARDARQEMFSWQEWKDNSLPQMETAPVAEEKRDWRENLTDEQRKRIASALSVGIILFFILICVLVYYMVT